MWSLVGPGIATVVVGLSEEKKKEAQRMRMKEGLENGARYQDTSPSSRDGKNKLLGVQ